MKLKYFEYLIIFICLFFLNSCFTTTSSNNFNDGILIKGEYIYIDNQPFIILGVGYAGWRPGQQPGIDKVDIDLVDQDFKRIKEAHFNTVRTWDALTSEELAIAQKYDLKVIQGIWLDPTTDFSDQTWQKDSLDYIQQVVSWSKNFSNVIMYLVMTEPTSQAVLYSSEKETLSFFHKVKNQIQELDNKPVSMDSWLPAAFLDYSMWDIVTFNVFKFTPEQINNVIGFENQIRWFKKHHAKNKPLLLGETGGFSVSPTKQNEYGYGGNTEVEQAHGNLSSLQQAFSSGVVGTIMVSWVDTWHYPSHPLVHEDHPWEWSGIVGFDDQEDLVGKPRKTYDALKMFNKNFNIDNYVVNNSYQEIGVNINQFEIINKNLVVELTLFDSENHILNNVSYELVVFFPEEWYEKKIDGVTDHFGKLKIELEVPNHLMLQKAIFALKIVDQKNKLNEKIGIYFSGKIGEIKGVSKRVYVYRDFKFPGNKFYTKFYMGDAQALTVDWNNDEHVYSGRSSVKVTYNPNLYKKEGWVAISWVYPFDDQLLKKSSRDLSQYSKLVFWIKGDKGDEILYRVMIGSESEESSYNEKFNILLTDQWQKVQIDLLQQNLSKIKNGFQIAITSDENPQGCVFYIDEIYFE